MDILSFIIGGLATGSVYGLAGVGLVLTYKTSGIFNFAYGSLATVSAFLFYSLEQHNVPWPLAVVISVLVAGPIGGLMLELIGRVLVRSGLVTQVVGMLGLVLIIEASVALIYGTTQTRTVTEYLPTRTFRIGGVGVSSSDLIVFGVSLVLTIGLYVYFRLSRTGLAMRAVVDDPDLLALAGTNATAIRRRAWIISVTFAAASGVLIAPLLAQIDATTLTLLVVTAFGAAAIGSFSSVPLSFLGGFAIGIAGSLATKYFTSGTFAQLPAALPFIVLFLVLVLSPRRRLVIRSTARIEGISGIRAPNRVQAASGIALLVFLLFVPKFAGAHLADWTTFAADIVLFLSLGLLVRTSGQVSLCHGAFLAIGAAAFSHFAVDYHVPWAVALLLAGLVAVPIGAILAFPAIRLSGLYLALASLGFGIVAAYVFYSQSYMFGQLGLGLDIPRPKLSWLNLTSDRAYYYLVLFIAVLTTAFLIILNRSRLGRLLKALSSSPTGLTTSGAAVNITRVLVFCTSAFLAAIAGALGGGVGGVVTGDEYSPLLSLTYFVLVVIAWGGDPWYAVLGAAGLALVPSYLSGPNVTNYLTLIFGVSALLYAITPTQRGLHPAVRALLDRIPQLRPARSSEEEAAIETPPTCGLGVVVPFATRDSRTGSGLKVSALRVRYGGVTAVDDLDFDAPTGRITGLIGPNGAGKTTTFNACSGLVRPTAGSVSLNGKVLARRAASTRARMGIGRTFQRVELFDNMTVAENVALGREASFAGRNPISHMVTTPSQRVVTAKAAAEALRMCDIADLADHPTASLSTGQRRLVELARSLAGPASMLLLDEPSSGLDRFETERFGDILRRVVAERGLGVLLVEHDMALVTAICDYIYVFDFGKLIFSGTSTDVMASELVRAAYLGDESIALVEMASLEADR